MDMLQYAASNSALYEADSIQCYGLFGRLTGNISLQNLVLNGKVSLSLIDKDNNVLETDLFTGSNNTTSRSVGGFIGYSSAEAEFSNVSLENMTVISPDICGGFVGVQSGNLTVNNCTYNNSRIKGKRYTGGVVAYVGNGEVSVDTLTASDSVVETRIDMSSAVPTSINFASGGVIGRLEGGSGAKLTDCNLAKTAVVFVTNIYKTSENAGAGGLIGIAKKKVTATNCKVVCLISFVYI